MRPTARSDQCLELAAGGSSNVEERPERTWREQRVAATRQDPCSVFVILAEPSQEDCFADPRLAADQHEASGGFGADRGERLLERV